MKKTIILVSVIQLFFSCKEKKDPTAQKANDKPQPTIVDVLIAGGSSVSNTIEVNGTVIPYENLVINPETSGRLTYLNVPDGARVSAGTVLARINDADLQANLNKTKVLLDLAQKTEQRLKKLLAINGINQADYDVALNQVSSLKADVAVIQAQLDKTVVKAPFSGVLGLRTISPGAYVSPATPITTLQQVDKVKIDFNVPELYTQLIRKGASVVIQTNETSKKRSATIVATDPQINTTTRNLRVRAVLEGSVIEPGTFVKVLLKDESDKNGILIPTNTIIPDAKAKKVILVKDGKGVSVNVETGYRGTGMVEITKGVKPGDSVVVTGVLFVRPNQPVKVRSVKQLSDILKNQQPN